MQAWDQEFAKLLRSQEQFIQIVIGQNKNWNRKLELVHTIFDGEITRNIMDKSMYLLERKF